VQKIFSYITAVHYTQQTKRSMDFFWSQMYHWISHKVSGSCIKSTMLLPPWKSQHLYWNSWGRRL